VIIADDSRLTVRPVEGKDPLRIVLDGRDAIPAVGGAGAEQVSEALHLNRIEIERIGEDLLVTGEPVWASREDGRNA
jgi:riboflavin biosynthesis pyrimidine reductase